jgi:hypothetical protein
MDPVPKTKLLEVTLSLHLNGRRGHCSSPLCSWLLCFPSPSILFMLFEPLIPIYVLHTTAMLVITQKKLQCSSMFIFLNQPSTVKVKGILHLQRVSVLVVC